MTPQEFAEAFHARDFATLREGLAQDVVLYSPITGRFHFEGRDEVLDLIRLVRDTFDEFEHLHAYGSDGDGTMVFRARIGRHELEGNDYIRFNREGRVEELRSSSAHFPLWPGWRRRWGRLSWAGAAVRSR